MENQQFTYVIAPEGCQSYFTPGKEYEVIGDISYISCNLGFEFYCKSDTNSNCYTLSKESTHLNGKDWIIPEIGQWPKGWTEKQKMECLKKAGVEISQSGFMRILGEEKPEPESTTDTFNSTDYQGRTNEQLEGSAKIFAICFVVLFLSLIIAYIIL